MTTGLIGRDDPGLARSSDLADVVRLISSRPVAADVEHRGAMLDFAAAHPDALLRTCSAGHFTGSAFVMDHTAERTLLLFHTKLQRWLQPGGHADGDANLSGVAWREAHEETGIEGLRIDPVPVDLDIHEIPAGKDPAHLHLDVRFVVVAPRDALVVGNHESQGLRWVAPDELDELDLDAGLHRLAAAAFDRARARTS